MDEAAKVGDMFITATGNKHAISVEQIQTMKGGAVLSNAGQFVYEIDVDGLNKVKTASREVRPNMEEITLPSGRSVYLTAAGTCSTLPVPKGTQARSWPPRSSAK